MDQRRVSLDVQRMLRCAVGVLYKAVDWRGAVQQCMHCPQSFWLSVAAAGKYCDVSRRVDQVIVIVRPNDVATGLAVPPHVGGLRGAEGVEVANEHPAGTPSLAELNTAADGPIILGGVCRAWVQHNPFDATRRSAPLASKLITVLAAFTNHCAHWVPSSVFDSLPRA